MRLQSKDPRVRLFTELDVGSILEKSEFERRGERVEADETAELFAGLVPRYIRANENRASGKEVAKRRAVCVL